MSVYYTVIWVIHYLNLHLLLLGIYLFINIYFGTFNNIICVLKIMKYQVTTTLVCVLSIYKYKTQYVFTN